MNWKSQHCRSFQTMGSSYWCVRLLPSLLTTTSSSATASTAYHPGLSGTRWALPELIPPIHQDYLQWTGTYFRSRTRRIGPFTGTLMDKILASRQFEVQSFRTCQGVLMVGKRLGISILASCKVRCRSWRDHLSWGQQRSEHPCGKAVNTSTGRAGGSIGHIGSLLYPQEVAA